MMKMQIYANFHIRIRENITPRGDGNFKLSARVRSIFFIRENITPRGDGNNNEDKRVCLCARP